MIKSFSKLIRAYQSFFYGYALFIICAGLGLLYNKKEESFLIINSHYNSVFDFFFKWITLFGDGLFFIFILLLLALYKYRFSLLGLIIFLITSLIVQILKLVIFDDVIRPIAHFDFSSTLHLVEGVTRHVKNSFPSGHTATAFALSLFLVIIFKLKKTGGVMLLVAILVAYSRVYLAVHFPIDVYFGSFIGVISTVVIYTLLNKPLKLKFGEKGLIAR